MELTSFINPILSLFSKMSQIRIIFEYFPTYIKIHKRLPPSSIFVNQKIHVETTKTITLHEIGFYEYSFGQIWFRKKRGKQIFTVMLQPMTELPVGGLKLMKDDRIEFTFKPFNELRTATFIGTYIKYNNSKVKKPFPLLMSVDKTINDISRSFEN